MITIGIDPGKGGGIVFIKDREVAHAFKCPDSERAMAILVKEETKGFRRKRAMIEQVHSMPRDGVVSAFSFGRNYGTWLGILAGLNINTSYVRPQVWQKFYGKLPKEKKSRKHKLKQLAFDLYPCAKNTLATADAVLIGHYYLNLGVIKAGDLK
jgi:crossover junction endodeoxyribonuclease RuvC